MSLVSFRCIFRGFGTDRTMQPCPDFLDLSIQFSSDKLDELFQIEAVMIGGSAVGFPDVYLETRFFEDFTGTFDGFGAEAALFRQFSIGFVDAAIRSLAVGEPTDEDFENIDDESAA